MRIQETIDGDAIAIAKLSAGDAFVASGNVYMMTDRGFAVNLLDGGIREFAEMERVRVIDAEVIW